MLLAQLFESPAILLMEVKARIEHPEDLVWDTGSSGVQQALHILDVSAKQPEQVSIKWDGCVHPDTVLLTTEGEMTIKQIIESHKSFDVLTYNFDSHQDEYHTAQYPRINTNNKNWVKINLENGESLILTEDHEVYVDGKGWIEARNLSPEDDIAQSKK
jgi:hypothetical protein